MDTHPKKQKRPMTVTIVFRDFISAVVPCRNCDHLPSQPGVVNGGLIILQHMVTMTPSADDMAVYRSWKKGMKVNSGFTLIGDGHVAHIGGDGTNLTFVLNGKTAVVNLNTSPQHYINDSGWISGRSKTSKENVALIRKAIAKLSSRINDFKPHLKEWRRGGTGLFTLRNGLVPLPKKFVPEGWPRDMKLNRDIHQSIPL